jgi:putative transposase
VKCFRFIRAERANHSISLMCRLLGVSRSGFHAWERRAPSARAVADAELTNRIQAMHARSRESYGVRRIHLDLRDEGVRVGRKRVERLMRTTGLSGYVKRRKRKTTIRVPGVRVADDLVGRDFNPAAPNRLWASDIKYVSTWEGTPYLATVLDCFSRKVVGWAMRADMQAELVVDALDMAVARRRPAGELVHHSDQGSQYVALVFGQRLRTAGIAQSMGSKGDCYDCQRRLRSLPRHARERAPPPALVPHPPGSKDGDLRLDRGLVQPRPPPLPPRLLLPRPVRA